MLIGRRYELRFNFCCIHVNSTENANRPRMFEKKEISKSRYIGNIPLRILKINWFAGVFRVYRNGTLLRNGLRSKFWWRRLKPGNVALIQFPTKIISLQYLPLQSIGGFASDVKWCNGFFIFRGLQFHWFELHLLVQYHNH